MSGDSAVTAENDHQIGHHRRFALLVTVDDVALTQPIEGQFDHPDGAVDDTGAGGDDGVGLRRRSIAWAISAA